MAKKKKTSPSPSDSNEYKRARYAVKELERKALGLCRQCPEMAVAGKRQCEKHSAGSKVHLRNLRARGLCQGCCAPLDTDKARCQKCLDKKNDKDLAERRSVFEAYGAFCSCCGESKEKFLSIDHIEDNGYEHRKEIGECGTALVKWAIKNRFPSSLRILCMNCNHGRSRNGGVCPHEQKRQQIAAGT